MLSSTMALNRVVGVRRRRRLRSCRFASLFSLWMRAISSRQCRRTIVPERYTECSNSVFWRKASKESIQWVFWFAKQSSACLCRSTLAQQTSDYCRPQTMQPVRRIEQKFQNSMMIKFPKRNDQFATIVFFVFVLKRFWNNHFFKNKRAMKRKDETYQHDNRK